MNVEMNAAPSRPKAIARRPITARVIVALAVLIAFSPVIGHDFGGWDDEQNLTRNPEMHPPTLAAVARYWKAPKHDLYAPLTWTVWSALAWAGYSTNAPSPDAQLNPYLFHAANLALHVGGALLAFELLRRLFGREALLASTLGALLFAVHPVQVEPVAWVSGLKDVLAGALSIAAIILFLDSTQDGKTDWRRFLCAMITFALALLSKPSAIVVPAMVIAFDTLIRQSSMRKSLVRFAPALALTLAAALIARAAQQADHLPSVEWWKRPVIAFDAVAFYLGKIIWPLNLGAHYGRTPQRVLAMSDIGVLWFLPIILAIFLILHYKLTRDRFPALAALILLIGISPVLSLLSFDFQEYSTVADHYLYLAMLGPAIFFAWSVARLRCLIFPIILLAICGVLSVRQSLTWRDALSISEQAVRVNPNSKLWSDRLNQLLFEQAAAHADRGDYKSAIATYLRLLKRDPHDARVPSDLASVYASNGQLDQAIFWYEWALRMDPNFEPARIGLQHAQGERKHPTTR
ncbi:hypothetical protein BH09PLA1_BH09PLA1_16250 [soil metagenome]